MFVFLLTNFCWCKKVYKKRCFHNYLFFSMYNVQLELLLYEPFLLRDNPWFSIAEYMTKPYGEHLLKISQKQLIPYNILVAPLGAKPINKFFFVNVWLNCSGNPFNTFILGKHASCLFLNHGSPSTSRII